MTPSPEEAAARKGHGAAWWLFYVLPLFPRIFSAQLHPPDHVSIPAFPLCSALDLKKHSFSHAAVLPGLAEAGLFGVHSSLWRALCHALCHALCVLCHALCRALCTMPCPVPRENFEGWRLASAGEGENELAPTKQ